MEDKAEEKRTEKETNFSQQVYDTLIDELTEESKIAGVENAYQEGSDCGQLYDDVLKTGWALSKNMGIENGDMHPDIQFMIDQLGKIQKILCQKMFHYGRLFGRQRISREIKFARLAKFSRLRYNKGTFKKNGGRLA